MLVGMGRRSDAGAAAGITIKQKAPRPLVTVLGAVCTSDAGSYGGETHAGALVGEATKRVVDKAKALGRVHPAGERAPSGFHGKGEDR